MQVLPGARLTIAAQASLTRHIGFSGFAKTMQTPPDDTAKRL